MSSAGVEPAASQAAIESAAQALMSGQLVAFPTETVYGLGADADNAQAVAQIYATKGRPSNHPVIVHLATPDDMQAWAKHLDQQAWQLAQAFWPGPLTLIVSSDAQTGTMITGGQTTVGLRCPSHPVARALLAEFARLKRQAGAVRAGVAAPSANRFGRISPTNADHVRQEFTEAIAAGLLVLQGGASEVGIESTIVDLSGLALGLPVTLLRPGAITASQIEAVLGQPVLAPTSESPRVSGSLKAHYAPTTPFGLVDGKDLDATVTQWLRQHPGCLAVMALRQAPRALDNRVQWFCMADDPSLYARDLYARLREMDDLGVAAIICQHPPQGLAWDGVVDRLTRAAAAFEGSSR